MRRLFSISMLLLVWSAAGSDLSAHESQPGTLELRQVFKDRFEVIWRAPIYYGRPHPARLELPGHWKTVVGPTMRMLSDSQVFRQVVTVGDQGVEGTILRFRGLENTITDVFVRLNRLDGTTMTAVVRPAKPYARLRGERSWHITAGEYIGLGFHHILQGVDHLLFVLGLLLIVKGRTMLLKTITAFTLAHSITLGIATLGYARVPLPPLNALVALSIMFLAPEILRSRQKKTSLTIRFPWIIAFIFGLLHGFGFASGLTVTGMPRSEIPLALLFFNIGVEVGQLGFVALTLLMLQSITKMEFRRPKWIEAAPGYVVGSLGTYWTLQRVSIMLSTG